MLPVVTRGRLRTLLSSFMLAAVVGHCLVAGCASHRQDETDTSLKLHLQSQLSPLPDERGVAGAFAGLCDNEDRDGRFSRMLVVAGGANFPDRMPWEGGTKVWTDVVYALGQNWSLVGRLPRPLAYGVSVTHGGGVVCVGGSDATRHYPDAFRMTLEYGALKVTPLPPLPEPLANACGALVGGRTLYVAGGTASPDATVALDHVWSIDLGAAESKWKSVPPIPGGGRMLAMAADMGEAFVVAGGAALEPPAQASGKAVRRYLRDVYRYDPSGGWRRLADLPTPIAAAPSPAPSYEEAFYVLGGDDGSQVNVPPADHKGFSRTVRRYDAPSDRWSEAGAVPYPRVTAPCVKIGERTLATSRGSFRRSIGYVVPSGEVTPGVRSPIVWFWFASFDWNH